METRDVIRSVVENISGICQLKPEQEESLVHILNDVVALLPTGFGKSLIYQLLHIVSEKLGRPKFRFWRLCPPWLPSWTIRLRRQQNSVSVLHSLVCTMIEKSWRGISALFLVAPNPGFSIQNGKLCWHQFYTKTTSSPLSLTRHTSHTNGGFAYTGLVINFNKFIYFDISSVRGGWASV